MIQGPLWDCVNQRLFESSIHVKFDLARSYEIEVNKVIEALIALTTAGTETMKIFRECRFVRRNYCQSIAEDIPPIGMSFMFCELTFCLFLHFLQFPDSQALWRRVLACRLCRGALCMTPSRLPWPFRCSALRRRRRGSDTSGSSHRLWCRLVCRVMLSFRLVL
jgi:hypothetical protein